MRYKAKIATTVALPNGRNLVNTMIRGAMAHQAGSLLTANPYEADRSPGYFVAWQRGWKLASAGLITVGDPGTRDRLLCREIERV